MPGERWARIWQVIDQLVTAVREQQISCAGCQQTFAREDMRPLTDLPQYKTWLGLLQWFCSDCQAKQRDLYHYQGVYQRENRVVVAQVRRAMLKGNPATLTLDQWLATLKHFEWRCAYCPDGSYEALEHFVPVEYGGGTTAANCVPACKTCNSAKGVRLPNEIQESSRSPTAIARVSQYLMSQQPARPLDGMPRDGMPS